MTTTSTDTPEAEADRVSVDRQTLGLRTSTPGIVVAVDPSGRFVDVQPSISFTQRLENTTEVRLPVVRGVPLGVMGSKTLGLFVCVPVSVGDDGLLVVSDRALDNWQYGEGVGIPPDLATPRHHDITDSVFYPGLQRMSGGIPGFPTNAVEVRNRAGTVKVAVSNTGVTALAGPSTFALTPSTFSASAGGASIALGAGNTDITGNLRINGQVYTAHTHSGVQPGAGNTGGVNP